jgi:hypothetical protein
LFFPVFDVLFNKAVVIIIHVSFFSLFSFFIY